MNRFTKMLPTHAGRLLIVLPALLLLAVLFFTPGLVPVTHAASTHSQVPAQPATSGPCASLGSLIISDPIKDGGTTLGELDVYYNGSTGYNCAYTKSGGPTWGVSKRMEVWLFSCAETTPGNFCTHKSLDFDLGQYSYYAGPVYVSARGHCIQAMGGIEWGGTPNNGYNYQVWTSPDASHCG